MRYTRPVACSCKSKPCPCSPSAATTCQGYGPGVAQPPGNTPPPVDSLACTVAGSIQAAVDRARRVQHQLGFRPYRVRLVWQARDTLTGKWAEDASLELMPVKVSGVAEIDYVVSEAGRTTEGDVRLTEVSPAQADQYTLEGYRDGKQWAGRSPDREFFYEIQQIRRCATDPEPRTYRMIPNGAPELDAENSQWVIRLTDQFGERSPAHEDQTVSGQTWVQNPARVAG